MQKKKPSFQAIPNYSINVVTNWNESKEVPAEQALQRYRPAQFLRPAQAFSIGLIAIAQTIAALARLGLNYTIPIRKWCAAITPLARSWSIYGSPVH
jgi:hypothetical protein